MPLGPFSEVPKYLLNGKPTLTCLHRQLLPHNSNHAVQKEQLYKQNNGYLPNEYALCMIRSHGTELIMLGRKLHSGTFKTKEIVPVQLDFRLL